MIEIDFNGDESLLSDDLNQTSQTIQQESEVGDNIEVGKELLDDDPIQATTQETNDNPEDFMTTFLKEMGIKDGRTITFKNEDESEEEVDFNTLDNDEKLNILKELTTPNLSQDEINVINYLRANNATIQDVIHYYSTKAVNDYISKNESREYSIDEYNDEELYIADLKSKFPDMTDEDIQADLENAKLNEDLFSKKTAAIRQQYKNAEDQQAQARIQEQENRYNTFKDSIAQSLTDFEDITIDNSSEERHVLTVEDSEREDIFRYILQQDENGASQFFKDLNDPSKLVKMAWLYKYGEQAIADVTNYWKSQLKSSRRQERAVTTTVPQEKKKNIDNFFKNPNMADNILGDHLL